MQKSTTPHRREPEMFRLMATYDANGNLTKDRNKDIDSIYYNHLNKPTLITFGTGNTIEYIYDAAGTKLRQNVSATTNKKTDYFGGFHYEACPRRGTMSSSSLHMQKAE